MIPNDRPIALYNADKQELIAIFSKPSLATYFLYEHGKRSRSSYVFNAIHNKKRICNSNHPCKIACRYANSEQVALLADNEWWVAEGYDNPLDGKKLGFDTSMLDMYHKQVVLKYGKKHSGK